LVDMLVEDASKWEVTVPEVTESLLARHRDATAQNDHEAALAFVEQAERLTGADRASPEVLLALAESHKAVAEAMLRAAAKDGSAISVAEADPETQRAARVHFLAAGEYFRRHGEAMVQGDADAYGESLWWSADAFDRAGDLSATVAAFQQFTTDFPSDRRHAEATYRLAQAFQARGDAELAIKLYRGLIQARDVAGAGSFTDASYVPLAQTLLLDADTTNDAEAQQLLIAVVTGAAGGTETGVFREALGELAASLYRAGEHERAIERFEEFMQRYGAGGPLPVTAYRLADSYRLSAAAIAVDLVKEDRPEGEKRDLEAKRVDRLRRASEIFERVRGEFEGMDHRTALEDLYLRNAYFYRADCLFDLREFDDSIRAYDGARERYSKDAASLVAMIQIVNALVLQGDLQQAATANARAKRFFESLPESVWDDPTLPMTRRDWERWLDSQVKLGPLASAGAAGTEPSTADAGASEEGN
ncbi:MAG: tetratricopeptide repeat protein, partial [bacterium]|nr:tetratricopeptide repeat protein [bacterium]